MKQILLITILYFSCLPVKSQGFEILSKSEIVIEVKLDVVKDSLERIQLSKTGYEFISELALNLSKGELSIDYELTAAIEDDQFFEINPFFRLNGENLIINPHEDLRGDYGPQYEVGPKHLFWGNLFDKYVKLEGNLEIKLEILLYGRKKLPYDCSQGPPLFIQLRKIDYLALSAGLISVGAGTFFYIRSRDAYRNDYLLSPNVIEARRSLRKVYRDQRNFQIYTYLGSAIVAADVIIYLIRKRNYKKKLELFNKWCKEGEITLNPQLVPIDYLDRGKLVGLTVKYTF